LHASDGGGQAEPLGISQVAVHAPLPVEPQLVVQATVRPGTQAESSSIIVSQSSSRPLQPSAGGVQAAGAGTVQVGVQVPVPVELHVVVQATGVPAAQMAGSSVNVSQSSSLPLQISAGGEQSVPVGIAQAAVQAPDPVVPQVVVHVVEVPCTQGRPLSGPPTQSSSSPLQLSAGGVQSATGGRPQASVQSPAPLELQEVMQGTALPRTQRKSSSVLSSQSSSTALHASVGGLQSTGAGGLQVAVHAPWPVVPQVVAQATSLPSTQPKPLSVTSSQSSSSPLHSSSGGMHMGSQVQSPRHAW
jgi:hypothetical protein